MVAVPALFTRKPDFALCCWYVCVYIHTPHTRTHTGMYTHTHTRTSHIYTHCSLKHDVISKSPYARPGWGWLLQCFRLLCEAWAIGNSVLVLEESSETSRFAGNVETAGPFLQSEMPLWNQSVKVESSGAGVETWGHWTTSSSVPQRWAGVWSAKQSVLGLQFRNCWLSAILSA